MLDVERILEEIVAIVFWRQEVSRNCQRANENSSDAGTDSAEDPGGVKVPTRDGEEFVMVEEERLI